MNALLATAGGGPAPCFNLKMRTGILKPLNSSPLVGSLLHFNDAVTSGVTLTDSTGIKSKVFKLRRLD